MVAFIVRDSALIQNYLQGYTFVKTKELTGGFLIIYTPEDRVDEVTRMSAVINRSNYPAIVGLMGREALDASGITQAQQQPFLDLSGRGVLLGFIDTGIDYTKDAFIYEDGTSKIQFIWDQSLEGEGPAGYIFGREFTNEQINGALAGGTRLETRDTVGHGTFLASVAASRERNEYAGAAPDSELIVVKLKNANKFTMDFHKIPPETENAFEATDVMIGVEYILQKALELGRPVAICISVGSNIGGHDGFTNFEQYLFRIAYRSGVVLCCAAGNEANARHHAEGRIANTGDIEQIEVSVGPSGGRFAVRLWNNASDRLSVSVTSPTGEMIGRLPVRSGAESRNRLIFERSIVTISYSFPGGGSGGQQSIVDVQDATPGIWKIVAHGDIIVNGQWNAWLPITGFVNPEITFLTPSPNTTIVVPATMAGAITVGAFNSLNKSLYAASSWGPNRLGVGLPDLTAPGSEVTGTFPTGHGKMEGTGVAAAITAGACALLLQWGIVEKNEERMNSYLARTYLIRGCDRDRGLEYPNVQWGYGRLNLINTFRMLRQV